MLSNKAVEAYGESIAALLNRIADTRNAVDLKVNIFSCLRFELCNSNFPSFLELFVTPLKSMHSFFNVAEVAFMMQ